ncbi:hypothetical protein ONO23_01593 [Micromonospora noduli]|nr:hypothetical protein ONO23_01593 [Micromonospora noduli]
MAHRASRTGRTSDHDVRKGMRPSPRDRQLPATALSDRAC